MEGNGEYVMWKGIGPEHEGSVLYFFLECIVDMKLSQLTEQYIILMLSADSVDK